LMAQPSPPTAIFCQSDVMAIGALQQAKKLGFRVPQDLSIIGFDDIKFSEFCDPPLTTVSQPRYEIGRQSMTLLLNMLKGQDIGTSSRLLEAKLVVRASAAPPRR
ncbi:MAG: substrate-binding domain-containing protein, partial [Plesiomonas shigelloides]